MLSSYNAYSKEPQQIGINYAYAEEFVDYHNTHSTFKRRMLTTKVVKWLAATFSIELGAAFLMINGLALWLCGFVLFFLARQLGYRIGESLISVIVFYVSYSILFAFFVTNYTYDEPLQYLFLLLSYLLLLKNNFYVFALTFLLAIFARETSLLFLPAIFYIAASNKHKVLFWSSLMVTTFFILFQLVYFRTGIDSLHAEQSFRFTLWKQNLATLLFRTETILSFLLVLIVPIFFTFQNGLKQNWKRYFLFLILINSLVVVLFTEARESRLFALPLLLFWPRAGNLIVDFFNHYWKNATSINLKNIVLMIFSGFLVVLTSYWLNEHYETTITPIAYNCNLQYAKLTALFLGILLYFKSIQLLTKYLGQSFHAYQE